MNHKREVKRIESILKWLSAIRSIIRAGGSWVQLQAICDPLGLNDKNFKDKPSLKSYLVDAVYWRRRLKAMDGEVVILGEWQGLKEGE